jgi:L-threonylcarbamoyladenylate synthase
MSDPPAACSALGPADAERLQRCLTGEGVALLPTDTVYGLACNPDSAKAVRRLYELKRRPPRKPAAVMFFDLDAALLALPELGERTGAALRALLPGPATLLVPNPRQRFPLACEGGLLGLRVPRLGGCLAALAAVGAPAMQSSANLSGGPEPRRLEDVEPSLMAGVDLALGGGELPGTASTVIDLSDYERDGVWRVVREGPVGREAIADALGD